MFSFVVSPVAPPGLLLISAFKLPYTGITNLNGKFNRFNAIGMTTHSRARKVSNVIKLDSNDNIVAILGAGDNDIVHLVGVDSIYDIPVNDIKEKSAIAPGVKMINDMIIKADIIQSM